MDLYTTTLRPLIFSLLKLDPEWAHHTAVSSLDWITCHAQTPATQALLAYLENTCVVTDPRLEQKLWNLTFPNPLGLAAGFDKDGIAAPIWDKFGFGYAELGTVTLHPQPGNPRPRLFRLMADEAILNRMGFNNLGSAALQQRLATWGKNPRIPLGINLGKSKITPLAEAAQDYLGSFQQLQDWGDYFVVNVSSPNTPGLRSLQDSEQLGFILEVLQEKNQGQKPILVKIAPDLDWEAIASVLEIAQTYQMAGIIATNTTIQRDNLKTQVLAATGNPVTEEAGGISGKPLTQRSTEVIRFIWRETGGNLPIIGVGGIFDGEDAWEKIIAGASLIQIYTGMIYEGPWMMQRVLKGLLRKLEDHGLNHITEAVGYGARLTP